MSDVVFIGFGTNEKWTSRLIRRATNSWCSHAWVEFGSPVFGLGAIHAQPEGIVEVDILDLLRQYPVNRRFAMVDVKTNDMREAIKQAIKYRGTPYDYGVIINALKLVSWTYLGRYSPIRRNPRELHCSEFATLVIQKAGVYGADDLDPEATHPGKLWHFVKDSLNFREV